MGRADIGPAPHYPSMGSDRKATRGFAVGLFSEAIEQIAA